MKRWKKRATIAGSIVCLLAAAVIIYNACTVVTFQQAVGLSNSQIIMISINKAMVVTENSTAKTVHISGSTHDPQQIAKIMTELGSQQFRVDPLASWLYRYEFYREYIFQKSKNVSYLLDIYDFDANSKSFAIYANGGFGVTNDFQGSHISGNYHPVNLGKVSQILDTICQELNATTNEFYPYQG